jgi:hypothetical protein
VKYGHLTKRLSQLQARMGGNRIFVVGENREECDRTIAEGYDEVPQAADVVRIITGVPSKAGDVFRPVRR